MTGPEAYFTLLALAVPALVAGLVVHQVGHSLVARLCGDTWGTGRISLHPRYSLQPLPLIVFALGGFCWAPPVVLTPFSLPTRLRRVVVALGGVAGNLLTLVLLSAVIRLVRPDPSSLLATFLGDSWLVTLMLTIVNVLPLPGLDGFLVIRNLVRTPPPWMRWMETNSGTLYALVIGAAIILPFVTGGRLDPSTWFAGAVARPLFDLAVAVPPPATFALPFVNMLFA